LQIKIKFLDVAISGNKEAFAPIRKGRLTQKGRETPKESQQKEKSRNWMQEMSPFRERLINPTE
jgi:hypothetical protein